MARIRAAYDGKQAVEKTAGVEPMTPSSAQLGGNQYLDGLVVNKDDNVESRVSAIKSSYARSGSPQLLSEFPEQKFMQLQAMMNH